MLAGLPLLQLLTQFYINSFMIIYLIYCQPFEDPFHTKIEVMNEYTSIVMMILMLSFTEAIPEAETRYTYGWLFMGLLCLNFAAHLCILFKNVLNKCVLYQKKYIGDDRSSPYRISRV